MNEDGDGCCDCGARDWDIGATIIACKACGRLWGRVNGAWVYDPSSTPRTSAPPEGDSPCCGEAPFCRHWNGSREWCD